MTTIGSTDRRPSHDWKRRGERLVAPAACPTPSSGPHGSITTSPTRTVFFCCRETRPLVGNPSDGVIARRQIAEVLVRSLRSDAALRKTFELHAEKGAEQDDFDTVFAPLQADPVGSLDAARDPENMPMEREPQPIVADLESERSRATTRRK